MTPSQYIELAHKTSAPVGPASDRLISDASLRSRLHFALNDLKDLCDDLDDIKREIYYGASAQKNAGYASLQKDLDKEYQGAAHSEQFMELLHAGLGLATEAGEFLAEIQEATVKCRPFNEKNLREEVGDSTWYGAKALKFLRSTFEAVMDRNIEKLKVRFPNAFTQHDAINRDLEKESLALDAAKQPA